MSFTVRPSCCMCLLSVVNVLKSSSSSLSCGNTADGQGKRGRRGRLFGRRVNSFALDALNWFLLTPAICGQMAERNSSRWRERQPRFVPPLLMKSRLRCLVQINYFFPFRLFNWIGMRLGLSQIRRSVIEIFVITGRVLCQKGKIIVC